MISNRWLTISLVLVACNTCAAVGSVTNQATAVDREVASIEDGVRANVVRVGAWALRALVHSIDEKCACFIVSLRLYQRRTDFEVFCRGRLISAGLSVDTFKSEIAKSLTMLWFLEEESDEALKHAVLTCIELDEDRARDDFYSLVAPIGCPPTRVLLRDKGDDYTQYMTEDEKWKYLLICSYYTARLHQSFVACFESLRPKLTVSEIKRNVNRSYEEATSSLAPSMEEIKFVLSVVGE